MEHASNIEGHAVISHENVHRVDERETSADTPVDSDLQTESDEGRWPTCGLVPVVRGGEGCHDHVPPVDVDDVGHSLQDVEVEVGVTGDGAVQTGLEE